MNREYKVKIKLVQTDLKEISTRRLNITHKIVHVKMGYTKAKIIQFSVTKLDGYEDSYKKEENAKGRQTKIERIHAHTYT